MEERIVDDEYGRGIRLKKTRDGYVDVEDELAPETEEVAEDVENEEELEIVLPEFTVGHAENADGETTYARPVVYSGEKDEDDEDLVNLSPEEAERVRKEKAEAERARKEKYAQACKEGEKLLATGSFHAAELAYEKALQLDGTATEASVGYWRAKTSDFTDPDVLIGEYVDEGIEALEYDLGFEATDIIKREYRAVFEKRLGELSEQEAPLAKDLEEKKASRKQVLTSRMIRTGAFFGGALLPFIAAIVATIVVAMKIVTVTDNRYVTPTIVLGCVSVALFILFLIATNKFMNACRMYVMNEKLSSTEEGKLLIEIRAYKELYEELLYVPEKTAKTEETDETDEE